MDVNRDFAMWRKMLIFAPKKWQATAKIQK